MYVYQIETYAVQSSTFLAPFYTHISFFTVPTWMFTIIIFLLCLTVVGFPVAIAVIVYVYKNKKGTNLKYTMQLHCGSIQAICTPPCNNAAFITGLST